MSIVKLCIGMCTIFRCSIAMRERPRSDVSDARSWWCPECKGRRSIREGSFFSKSRLSLKQWLVLLHYWLREFPVTTAALDAEVNKSTAIDVYQWFREVCSTTLLNSRIVLGGNGKVVEIDESLFRHKPKVTIHWVSNTVKSISASPLQHHRGRPPTSPNLGVWYGGRVTIPWAWLHGDCTCT